MAQWFLKIDIWALKLRKLTSKDGTIKFQSISPNEFGEVPHTIGCKTPLGTVG